MESQDTWMEKAKRHALRNRATSKVTLASCLLESLLCLPAVQCSSILIIVMLPRSSGMRRVLYRGPKNSDWCFLFLYLVDGENRYVIVDWGNHCIRSIVGTRRNGFCKAPVRWHVSTLVGCHEGAVVDGEGLPWIALFRPSMPHITRTSKDRNVLLE